MKKLFALMVVFAALVATGCAEKETKPVPPPAEDTAASPAEDAPAETPTEPGAP